MSNEKKFKGGNVVRLKTGGPMMAIVRYLEDGRVLCFWFAKNERKDACFEEESLEAVKENDTKEEE